MSGFVGFDGQESAVLLAIPAVYHTRPVWWRITVSNRAGVEVVPEDKPAGVGDDQLGCILGLIMEESYSTRGGKAAQSPFIASDCLTKQSPKFDGLLEVVMLHNSSTVVWVFTLIGCW